MMAGARAEAPAAHATFLASGSGEQKYHSERAQKNANDYPRAREVTFSLLSGSMRQRACRRLMVAKFLEELPKVF
jgi:hypothetical protein